MHCSASPLTPHAPLCFCYLVLQVPLVDSLTDCCITVPTLDGRTLSLPCPEVLNPGTHTPLSSPTVEKEQDSQNVEKEE